MNSKNDKQKEFSKLYLTGKYTQKTLAEKLGISRNTANNWAKTIQPLSYFSIRKQLTQELTRLTKLGNYAANAELITRLIADIESIERLITKAKYIPHLTQPR